MENLPFHLQDNEKIILAMKPKPMFVFQDAISKFIVYLIMFAFIAGFGFSFSKTQSNFLLTFIIILIFVIFFSIVTASIRYTKENYWITNQRVIFKRGFFGYSVTSLPLERIVDVVISRSFFQQIFGTPSLHLDTFGSGSVGGANGNYANMKGTMFAVHSPEDLQKQILELVKKKRKTEKLSI